MRIWLFLTIFSVVSFAGTVEIRAFTQVVAKDTPNDAGRSIVITWQKSPNDREDLDEITGYEILRSREIGKGYVSIGSVERGIQEYVDNKIEKDGVTYYYIIRTKGRILLSSTPSNPVMSKEQWYNTSRTNVLVATLILAILIIWFIFRAKRGRSLFIRRIPGLSAVDEAVGRATEMGKPILFVPGTSNISDVATLAALNILGELAKKVAEYESYLIVPNIDPVVYTIAQQVVKEGYTKAGHPETYKPENIFFLTDSQMGYAAAVDGIMLREKAGANFFFGMFQAESLVLAETGSTTGAIQIAATDAVTQLPFFITACDYTLIGEELFAASAYLSRESLLLGSLKGQDWSKVVIVVLLIIGTILSLLGMPFFIRFFRIG